MRPNDVPLPASVRVLFFILLTAFCIQVAAQMPDSTAALRDSAAAVADTLIAGSDTPEVMVANKDTNLLPRFFHDIASDYSRVRQLQPAVAAFEKERKPPRTEALFYSVLFVALLLGILRISFPSYFNNLFRVFFNTSLRQGQLTDQLLQAVWPSILFNVFFFASGGFYIYLLLGYFGKLDCVNDVRLLPLFIGGIACIYLFKFFWLKFIGWVSGMPQELNSYIFTVYLVNKMTGICLLPFLPVLAFADKSIVSVTLLLSVIMAGFMLVVRFLRSYSLAASRMRIPTFHFVIYILCLEVLPLLILIRLAVMLLNKNL